MPSHTGRSTRPWMILLGTVVPSVALAQSPPSAAAPSVATPPDPPLGSTSGAATGDAAGAVVVTGTRRTPGGMTLLPADARELAGSLEDPLRAMDAMPGVSPVRTATPIFFIRGAPPNDTGFFLDGIRVPSLFHAGLGPSVVHPALLERVDLFSSVPPLRFGNVAGGVLAATTNPPSEEAHARAAVRLVDSSALVESPIADGTGSVLVAGRYGYPNLLLGAVAPATRLGYWDYQARGTRQLGPHDALTVFVLGSGDDSATVDNLPHGTIVRELSSSHFHLADFRFDHDLGRSGTLRVATTLGSTFTGAAPLYASDQLVSTRLELEDHVTPALELHGGLEVHLDGYALKHTRTSDGTQVPSSADPPPRDGTAGAYVELSMRLAPRVDASLGGRFELYDSRRSTPGWATSVVRTAVDPRLAVRAELSPAAWWVGAVGVVHQFPSLRVGTAPATVATVPGFSDPATPLQASYQISQGLGFRLPGRVTLTTTAFLSRSLGLTDVTAECAEIREPGPTGVSTRYLCSDAPVQGTARGLELLVRRSLTQRLGGWLSYTLSRTTREAHFGAGGRELIAEVPGDYDRTHVLNAALALDAGRNWRLGARAAFYTGKPYWPPLDGGTSPPSGSRRLPSFFRLDLRAEKRWSFEGGGSVALSLEVQNATLSADVTGLACAPASGAQRGCIMEKSTVTVPILGIEMAI